VARNKLFFVSVQSLPNSFRVLRRHVHWSQPNGVVFGVIESMNYLRKDIYPSLCVLVRKVAVHFHFNPFVGVLGQPTLHVVILWNNVTNFAAL
jgi:hypothetical protein